MPNDSHFDKGGLIAPINDWRSAICDSGLPPSARHVALTLSLHLKTRGQTAFPGADCLAYETGLTSRTVRSQLALLVDAGYLQLLQRGGLKGKRKMANLYRASVPQSVLDLWNTPETVSPVKLTTRTPENDDDDGGNGFTPTSDLTSEELAGSSFLPGSGRVTEFKPVPFAEEDRMSLDAIREQRKEATRKEQSA